MRRCGQKPKRDEEKTPTGRLDEIPGQWSLLRLAHDSPSQVGEARNTLVRRYAKAIRNYVGALM